MLRLGRLVSGSTCHASFCTSADCLQRHGKLFLSFSGKGASDEMKILTVCNRGETTRLHFLHPSRLLLKYLQRRNRSTECKILQYSIFSSHQKYVAHSFPSCPQMNFLGRQSSKKIAARMPGDWYMWPASVTEIVKMKTSAVLHVFPVPQPYPLVLLLCWLIISHNLC